MVQLILGKKGKGKTKIILDMVNKEVNDAKGNIVYLDKSMGHMYELNNKVRLINVLDYEIANADEFFMGVAKLAARRSKDPNTQVGACIVSKNNRILSVGYNGTPNG